MRNSNAKIVKSTYRVPLSILLKNNYLFSDADNFTNASQINYLTNERKAGAKSRIEVGLGTLAISKYQG